MLEPMQELREQGWFCEMNLPCCDMCAWSFLPDDVDKNKVFFNTEKELEFFGDTCSVCQGDGYILDENSCVDCDACAGNGCEVTILKPDEVTSTIFHHQKNSPRLEIMNVFKTHNYNVKKVSSTKIKVWKP